MPSVPGKKAKSDLHKEFIPIRYMFIFVIVLMLITIFAIVPQGQLIRTQQANPIPGDREGGGEGGGEGGPSYVCNNGIMDGAEQGVDCGGSCPVACLFVIRADHPRMFFTNDDIPIMKCRYGISGYEGYCNSFGSLSSQYTYLREL